jgi:hypothetical protein
MVMCSLKNDQLYTLDPREGWISRRETDGVSRRVCWLPYERRAEGILACWNERVCIGSVSGVVTILSFADLKRNHAHPSTGPLVL